MLNTEAKYDNKDNTETNKDLYKEFYLCEKVAENGDVGVQWDIKSHRADFFLNK